MKPAGPSPPNAECHYGGKKSRIEVDGDAVRISCVAPGPRGRPNNALRGGASAVSNGVPCGFGSLKSIARFFMRLSQVLVICSSDSRDDWRVHALSVAIQCRKYLLPPSRRTSNVLTHISQENL